MSFPIQPVFDLLFVKKDSEALTASGLHLPVSVKGRAVTGKVVAIGPGLRNHEGTYLTPDIKVGDTVYVKEFSGYIVRYKDEEVHVFHENEIIGIVKDVPNV